MDIKLKKEEPIYLDYLACPRCHTDFNQKKNKKTKHHAIPKFLNPKTEVVTNLCLACHEELNSYYQPQRIVYKDFNNIKSANFKEFKEKYEELRKRFHNKEINRGQFGEGLWSNLVSFMENLVNEVEELKNG